MNARTDAYAYPPRGLSREEAARYLGITINMFDDLIALGRMPPPKKIGRRNVWDRHQIDVYFTDLPTLGDNWIERKMAEGAQFAGLKKD